MRTPWRFVADLVSRKPKPHRDDESPAVVPKTIALEYKSVPDDEHPGPNETAVARSVEAGSEAQVEAKLPEPEIDLADAGTGASGSAEADAVSADIEEPADLPISQQPEETSSAPMQAEAVEPLVTPAPARRKKVKPIAEPAVSAEQTGDVVPAATGGPRSFTDEMTDLNTEVDALRRELAKKLTEQNAQLRKMLARFDAR